MIFVVIGHALLCITIHILISVEKRNAFIRIEKSVVAHMDVQQEIAKQVFKKYLHHLFMIWNLQEKLLCSIFPSDIAKTIQESLYNVSMESFFQFRNLHVSEVENVR